MTKWIDSLSSTISSQSYILLYHTYASTRINWLLFSDLIYFDKLANRIDLHFANSQIPGQTIRWHKNGLSQSLSLKDRNPFPWLSPVNCNQTLSFDAREKIHTRLHHNFFHSSTASLDHHTLRAIQCLFNPHVDPLMLDFEQEANHLPTWLTPHYNATIHSWTTALKQLC